MRELANRTDDAAGGSGPNRLATAEVISSTTRSEEETLVFGSASTAHAPGGARPARWVSPAADGPTTRVAIPGRPASTNPSRGPARPKTRRRRRGSGEVRQLMLDAARELFAEHGYRGTTTRELAQRADVTEALIYSHFTNKANLFEAAVVAPVEAAIGGLVQRREPRSAGPDQLAHWARDCVAELYDLFGEHRRLLLTLITAQAHDPELSRRLRDLLGGLSVMVLDGAPTGWVFDARACLAVELVVGGVLAAAVHGDLLFEAGAEPTRETVLEHFAGQLRAAGVEGSVER